MTASSPKSRALIKRRQYVRLGLLKKRAAIASVLPDGMDFLPAALAAGGVRG